jgi:hypothetical protein
MSIHRLPCRISRTDSHDHVGGSVQELVDEGNMGTVRVLPDHTGPGMVAVPRNMILINARTSPRRTLRQPPCPSRARRLHGPAKGETSTPAGIHGLQPFVAVLGFRAGIEASAMSPKSRVAQRRRWKCSASCIDAIEKSPLYLVLAVSRRVGGRGLWN